MIVIQYCKDYHPTPWFVESFEGVFQYPDFSEAEEAHPDADLSLPAMTKLLEEVLG